MAMVFLQVWILLIQLVASTHSLSGSLGHSSSISKLTHSKSDSSFSGPSSSISKSPRTNPSKHSSRRSPPPRSPPLSRGITEGSGLDVNHGTGNSSSNSPAANLENGGMESSSNSSGDVDLGGPVSSSESSDIRGNSTAPGAVEPSNSSGNVDLDDPVSSSDSSDIITNNSTSSPTLEPSEPTSNSSADLGGGSSNSSTNGSENGDLDDRNWNSSSNGSDDVDLGNTSSNSSTNTSDNSPEMSTSPSPVEAPSPESSSSNSSESDSSNCGDLGPDYQLNATCGDSTGDWNSSITTPPSSDIPNPPTNNSSAEYPTPDGSCTNSSTSEDLLTQFSVLDFGASGDGQTDDSQAFANAWTAACATNYGYVHVPGGHSFMVYPITFKGPCLLNMTMQIDGTILAPSEPSVWDTVTTKSWLYFKSVAIVLQGSGTINGQGQTWWAESCKTNTSNACTDGPTAVVFSSCKGVTVQHVTILNSQQMHLAFEKSSVITVNYVNISAPGTSPNTDGIHLQNSTSVTILNSFIGTGDDCISIQNGSATVLIKNMTCGPGHGISVGGLGKKNTSALISDVVVQDVVFTNSTNGVRIKSWQGSSGTASGFTYKNLRMNNVKNPILIDQYYCDSSSSGSCPNFTSSVVISGVSYKNITGTSATKVAIKFACSETVSCTGISLQDINVVQTSGSEATTSCTNAWGTSEGTVTPTSCLQTSS